MFLVLSFALAIVIVSLFGLRRFKIHPADLVFPFLAIAFYIVSDRIFYHSLIPVLTLILSITFLGVALHFIRQKKSFPYGQVVKIFWRLSFIVTLALYLALLIYVLFLA